LRWDRPAVTVATVRHASLPGTAVPTHVLHAARVYRIGGEPLYIGSELAPDEYGIGLPAGNPGVSRRHCSIHQGPNGVELTDHSRFGTRLNGHEIDQAAVLQAGDVISIGEPPVEMNVVAEVTVQGSGDGT